MSGESSATALDQAETSRGDRKSPLFIFKMNSHKFRDPSCLLRGKKRHMSGVKTKRVNIRHQEPKSRWCCKSPAKRNPMSFRGRSNQLILAQRPHGLISRRAWPFLLARNDLTRAVRTPRPSFINPHNKSTAPVSASLDRIRNTTSRSY